MSYIDGFLIPVPRAKLDAYTKMAELGRDVWMEYGATEYHEYVADDVKSGEVTSFPQAVKLEADEVVVFSWVVYPSREARDEIMAKVMADPRMKHSMEDSPFDMKRMMFGGFKPLVTTR